MSKKLFAACLVIAAFAVVPSLASANPILTEPTGTALTGEPNIVGTNVGETTMTTSLGNLHCTTAILTGKLKSNTTASGGAKGEITSAKFGGTGPTQSGAPEPECTGSNFFTPNTTITPEISTTQGLPWCLEAGTTDTFTVKGGTCGSQRPITFALDITGIGTCRYIRETTINGTLVTDGAGANENTMSITNVAFTKEEPSAFGCPGEGQLDMKFSLETENGTQIFISS